MTQPRPRFSVLVALAFAIAVGVAAGLYIVRLRHAGLPAPGSAAYEQTTRHFYRGLAGLQVGLIDGSKQEFAQAAELAPGEPASFANLGLAHLRLGEFDLAAPAIARAAELAPSHAAVAFLQGRLETARGRRDEGLAHLRRAVDLDPENLHARTALVQEIENAGGPGADDEAQQLLEELVTRQPDNPAVIVERARLAAKRGDAAVLQDSVARLEPMAAAWPPEVVEQYRALQQAAAAGASPEAARAVAFLRNVLARVPAFLEARSRVTPAAELIAEPFVTFIRLPAPSATPSPADRTLAFAPEPLPTAGLAAARDVLAFSPDGVQAPVVFAADGREVRRLNGEQGGAVVFPGSTAGDAVSDPTAASPGRPHQSLLALDWNHDFRMDVAVAGPGGVRLFLQSADGAFTDATAAASAVSGPVTPDAVGAWAADVEMDGDLDLVVGVRAAGPMVLRNNGDGSWLSTAPFGGVNGIARFVWGDLDSDGDPDAALLDGDGALHLFANLQAGQFRALEAPSQSTGLRALALGDVDADGVLDLVTLDGAGVIRRASLAGGSWTEQDVASWPEAGEGEAGLFVADLDNNGAVDLLASTSSARAIWLAEEDRAWQRAAIGVDADVRDVLDLTGDGLLDFVGLSADGAPVRLIARASAGYHHHVVRPRAQTAAGDQRINSFGIGGEVEVRSGLLVQKQPIAGQVVHLGLGSRTAIDVTRILWPNGVPQAEFDPVVDQPLVADQRLKGSCPWVFAYDGTTMRFVTDFLWRSPLGLRINAQDTAGVTQTEDWVRIRGDQLVARDGVYDLRITAELWETHYIDHVSLVAVDHPADTDVFVDERFAPAEPPALAVHAMRPPRPVAQAWDHDGLDVTELVRAQDGRYLGTFDRGRYQGIAEEHFVEIDLGAPLAAGAAPWLVAQGWIYPTDSSINVAIGQGRDVRPHGLSLEAQAADGRWVVINPGLGFPAGKNKTILVDLGQILRAGAAGARRVRLRTNLEIYWDAIGLAERLDEPGLRMQRMPAVRADLRFRGFSETRTDRRDLPETPVYDRIANVAPRWRDLAGYHTRFGDVRELVADVEDRYVIMNAGDELRLSFDAPAPPPDGWTRDFVLVGDGWEKDGDYNTGYSKTVLPLPTHGAAEYTAASPEPVLEQDPVYQRYPEDWQTYHTRFVSPRTFLRGLHMAPRLVEAGSSAFAQGYGGPPELQRRRSDPATP